VGFSVQKWNPCPGRAELLFFCLECEDHLPDLLVRLGGVRLLFGLVSRGSGSMSFMGYFTTSFPVSSIDSLDEFPEAESMFGFSWWDHVVFDMFG